MILEFLARLKTVKRARSPEEFEAIWRLRYDIYIHELDKKFMTDVDHDNQMVRDARDSHPDSMVCYIGDVDDIQATMRVDTWPPGQVPDDVYQRFSLSLIPNVNEVTIAEVGRLVVPKKHRGTLLVPAMVREIYKFASRTKKVAYAFLYCAPGLVPSYKRMGYRPYAGGLVYNNDGVRIPMINILSDLDYLKKVKAPYFDLARKIYKKSQRHLIDPVRPVLDEGLQYTLDQDQIWSNIQESFLSEPEAAQTLSYELSPEALKYLSDKGFIIAVASDHKMVSQDLVEQEMFIILDGVFEVIVDDRRVALLKKGELFGEMAFFLNTKRRTATVRSVTPGELLVIRRRYLDEIQNEAPKLAIEILTGICRTLTSRLAKML